MHGTRVVAPCAGGGSGEIPVGLVHHDEICEFHDPALDALELVTTSRRHEEGEEIDHVGDGDLGLSDTDGLDDHDIEAGRLTQEHRLAGATGDATELGAAR